MLQTYGHDKYKRTIAEVVLPDGMNLNQELVKQGWSCWYQRYAPGDTALGGLENEHEKRERDKDYVRFPHSSP